MIWKITAEHGESRVRVLRNKRWPNSAFNVLTRFHVQKKANEVHTVQLKFTSISILILWILWKPQNLI